MEIANSDSNGDGGTTAIVGVYSSTEKRLVLLERVREATVKGKKRRGGDPLDGGAKSSFACRLLDIKQKTRTAITKSHRAQARAVSHADSER